MPKSTEEDLVWIATEALEEEIKAWVQIPEPIRFGPNMVRLRRYPPMDLAIGPFNLPDEATETIEDIVIPKERVWPLLRNRGMKAALKAVKKAEADQAELARAVEVLAA